MKHARDIDHPKGTQAMATAISATPSKLDPEAAPPRDRRRGPTNAATIARIAAWNVIADADLPAGTKVSVKDGWVTLHPLGEQPARVPYGPESTLESLCSALKAAARATPQADH